MNSLESITLYDLMADDLDVWLTRVKNYEYIIRIDNYEGTLVYESSINPAAIDSFADFCSQFLHSYDRLSKTDN